MTAKDWDGASELADGGPRFGRGPDEGTRKIFVGFGRKGALLAAFEGRGGGGIIFNEVSCVRHGAGFPADSFEFVVKSNGWCPELDLGTREAWPSFKSGERSKDIVGTSVALPLSRRGSLGVVSGETDLGSKAEDSNETPVDDIVALPSLNLASSFSS